MSKPESKIAAATGIAMRGSLPMSAAIENAMARAALAGHAAGHDAAQIRAAMEAAREKVKAGSRN